MMYVEPVSLLVVNSDVQDSHGRGWNEEVAWRQSFLNMEIGKTELTIADTQMFPY